MIFDELVAFAGQIDTSGVDLRESQIQYEIDGLLYTTTKLPCTKGLEVFQHLQAVLGPVLPAVITGNFKGLDPRLASLVAENGIRHGMVAMVKDLLSSTVVNHLRSGGVLAEKGGNVRMHFDEHYSGEYPHLLRVCLFVLAHNFRGPTLGAP